MVVILLCVEAHAAQRPNFILFIADDLAWDDVGAYGHKTIRTPNIDKLAREGMRFDRAFLTCSSCSPSRSSIITGRYPHNTDAEQLHWPLPAVHVTFVELLKSAGYWTASAGKWHLGEAAKQKFDVVKEADPSGFQLAAGAKQIKAKGDQSGCIDWLPTLRDRPKDKPFFLWLAALDPHRDYEPNSIPQPYRPEDIVLPPYLPDHPDVRKDLALYYDEITRLDGFVGQVLEELDRQGERDNTFVLFISDNGRPFPRDKTTLYDSGIKTPWIVRWPGNVTPETVCRQLVSSVDIAPTMLELAGVKIPASFEGRSFSPLLKDPRRSIRQYVYAERHWHDYEAQLRAIRSPRYKYIRNAYPEAPNSPPADAVRSLTYRAMQQLRDANKLTPEQMACFLKPRPVEELYDLDSDPFELKNLAGSVHHAKTLAQLRDALFAWQRATNDEISERRTPDEFDRETGEPLPTRKRPRPSKQQMLEAAP
ncbi:MAG: sulfatase [Verrucomicrobiota bacterium]